jgi:menaquinone-dependent protoporphyrinogen oxidase
MRLLVAHASKHGATVGIAQRIAEKLTHSGHDVTVRPLHEAGDPAGFDAVIVGSATYMGHWLKDAKAYVRDHQQSLASRPVWLFSSGPLGEAEVDDDGRDLREAGAPSDLPGLQASVHPREHRVFFGALDPKRLSLSERALRTLPAGRALFPEGDFREGRTSRPGQLTSPQSWNRQTPAEARTERRAA